MAYFLFIKEMSSVYNIAFLVKRKSSKLHSKPIPHCITPELIKSLREKKNTSCRKYFFKYKLNHIIRCAKKHYFSTELSKNKNNMRAFWTVINQILNKTLKKKSLPNEFKVNESLIKDPVKIAKNFNQIFTEIGPTLASKIPMFNEGSLQFITAPTTNGFHFSSVTSTEDLYKILLLAMIILMQNYLKWFLMPSPNHWPIYLNYHLPTIPLTIIFYYLN